MKLVTNTAPVLPQNTYPLIDEDGKVEWDKVNLIDEGTIFKVKAISMNQVWLENNVGTLIVDVNLYTAFFRQHDIVV